MSWPLWSLTALVALAASVGAGVLLAAEVTWAAALLGMVALVAGVMVVDFRPWGKLR